MGARARREPTPGRKVTAMAEDALVLDHVDVFYGSVQALFDVSIRVADGETVAVLGGNASGKSTTIRTALGLVQARKGTVRVLGRDISGLTTSRVVALGVGSIPEGRRVFPEMSVRENLLMGAYLRRREGMAQLDSDVDEALTLFPDLKERIGQLAGTLSGGEQQMLAMARAWLRRPRLLCIDEPSMGLSPKFVDRIYAVIATLRGRGVTILMVEQSATMALQVADRAYVLRSGHIAVQGDARQLAGDPSIRKAYLGEGALAEMEEHDV